MALTDEQLKMIRVGQKLFVHYPHSPNREVEITKIGDKYFYTNDDRRWYKKDGTQVSEYTKAQLFFSEFIFHEIKEKNTKWQMISGLTSGKLPQYLTIEQMDKIIEIIRDGSK